MNVIFKMFIVLPKMKQTCILKITKENIFEIYYLCISIHNKNQSLCSFFYTRGCCWYF